MPSILRLSACLLVTVGLAACHRDAPAPAVNASATAPASPATSAAPATPAATPRPAASAGDDLPPVALDMGKVKAYVQAQKNLAHAAEADPNMGDPAQNVSEENSAKYAARLHDNAKMRAAIEAAGLSTQDFARIGDALMGGMMTEAGLASGQLKKIPDGIDPASVEFFKQHKAEINAMLGATNGG